MVRDNSYLSPFIKYIFNYLSALLAFIETISGSLNPADEPPAVFSISNILPVSSAIISNFNENSETSEADKVKSAETCAFKL